MIPSTIIGRDKPINDLLKDCQKSPGNPPHLYYFIGYGGMGKTKVLRYIHQRIEEGEFPNTICALLDLQTPEILSIDGLLYTLVDQLHEALERSPLYFQKYYRKVQQYIRAESDHTLGYRQELLNEVYEAFRDSYWDIVQNYHVMLFLDTMEQFDKDDFLIENDEYRNFFQNKILTLFGTSYVLCGRHASSAASDAIHYIWHDKESGIFPYFYYYPIESIEADNRWDTGERKWTQKPKIHEFAKLNSGQTRQMLEKLWAHLEHQKVQNTIQHLIETYKELPEFRPEYPHIVEQHPLTSILSNPLKLILLAEQMEQENLLDEENYTELRDILESYIVTKYFSFIGIAPDIVAYMALKNYEITPADLAEITHLSEKNERRRLNELTSAEKSFIRELPNGTYLLHDEMRDLIMKYLWQATDKDGEKQLKLYNVIFRQYDRSLFEIQQQIIETAQELQRLPLIPRHHALEAFRAAPSPNIDDIIENFIETEQDYIALKNAEHWADNTEQRLAEIQYWLRRQNLERREKVIIRQLRRLVKSVEALTDDCDIRMGYYIEVFKIEWYNKRYSDIAEMGKIINEAKAKLTSCEIWEDLKRDEYTRVYYSYLRYLEAAKNYHEANTACKRILLQLSSLAEYNPDLIKERLSQRHLIWYTRFRYRLGTIQLNLAEVSQKDADAILMEALDLANEEKDIDFRSSIEAKIAQAKHISYHHHAAEMWYTKAIESLGEYKNHYRRRINLLDWLAELGYVKRYSEPRIGIQIAWISYIHLRQVQIDTSTIETQRILSVLYRRNGAYEDAIWYALLSYNLAHQVQRHDLVAYAQIEIAITLWYTLRPFEGSDQFRNHIAAIEQASETDTPYVDRSKDNLAWVANQLEMAFQVLNEPQQIDYTLMKEKIRVTHLLSRVFTQLSDTEDAKHYNDICRRDAMSAHDGYRLLESYLDELIILLDNKEILTYQGLQNHEAFQIIQASLDEKSTSEQLPDELLDIIKSVPNYDILGQTHILAAQVALEDANRLQDPDRLQLVINHIQNAYIFFAQAPLSGTLNCGDNWLILERQCHALEQSDFSNDVKIKTIRSWCKQIDDVLYRPDVIDVENPKTIHESFPQVSKLIQIKSYQLSLQEDEPQTILINEEDFNGCVEQYYFERANNILLNQEYFSLDELDITTVPDEISLAHWLNLAIESGQYELASVLVEQASFSDSIYEIINRSFFEAVNPTIEAHHQSFRKAYDTLIQLRESVIDKAEPFIQGLLCRRIAQLYFYYGHSQACLMHYEKALEIYVGAKQVIASAFCATEIGLVYAETGNHELAILYSDYALSWFRQINHQEGIIYATAALGIAYRSWGLVSALKGSPGTISSRYEHAQAYFNKAIGLSTQYQKKYSDAREYKRYYQYYMVDILLEQAILTRYESSRHRTESSIYLDFLYHFNEYRIEAETLLYKPEIPKNFLSVRQQIKYMTIAGDYNRRMALLIMKQPKGDSKPFAKSALNAYQDGFALTEIYHNLGYATEILLSRIELRFFGTWINPAKTAAYKGQEQQFSDSDTNMYLYFVGDKDNNQQGSFWEFRKIEEELDKINQCILSTTANKSYATSDLINHRLARLETLKAFTARDYDNQLAVKHYINSGRYFCSSRHVTTNLNGLVTHLHDFLRNHHNDDKQNIINESYAKQLYDAWESIDSSSEFRDELRSICWAFMQLTEEDIRQSQYYQDSFV